MKSFFLIKIPYNHIVLNESDTFSLLLSAFALQDFLFNNKF